MQTPTWTTTPTGERETTWWGEVFHLAKDSRFWYLHRGPATPHIPSMAAHSIAPLDTTLGDSTTLAGVYLNGWAAPTLTRDGDVYTHLDGTRRELPDLAAELAAAPAYTPTRGEACVSRALESHLRECDATRLADTCHARETLTSARHTELLTLMKQIIDSHPDVRWYKPAKAGQVVVHFAAADEPRIAGGIGYDLHHRSDWSPWRAGAEWADRSETGHRSRVRVPTAAQLAGEITRQVNRVREAVTAAT